jgi:hypothetical protein
MSTELKRLIVTGDQALDRFLYVEGIKDEPPNLRDAWIGANRFWTELLKGRAGSVIECLVALGYDAIDPFDQPDEIAESVYILTRQGTPDERKWRIGQAIVVGESDVPCCQIEPLSKDQYPSSIPAIFVDFNQGCLKENAERILGFMEGRRYIIRTPDPRKHAWAALRKRGLQPGIWFSPLQDMFDGALSFAGNWEHIQERLLRYLRADPTLWSDGAWLHHLVIQIHSDGALVLGPGQDDQDGTLFIFAGDQPGSFSRKGYGAVIGGGTVFLASLAKALYDPDCLLDSTQQGLSLLRRITEQGYIGPDSGVGAWKLQGKTNLPIDFSDKSGKEKIIKYTRKAPEADWDAIRRVVCGDDNDMKSVTVLNMGNLTTSSPDYAQTLLRFESRLKNHVSSGKGILSFTIFGGPGSGKSFVAEELAKAVNPKGDLFQIQIYNISQFGDPSRLLDAFDNIQTIGLQGKIPFVLWDEFDSSYQGAQGGWLPYFLMPMQDAKFFDGSHERALGKCIFVFIGGTFNGENDFREWALNSREGKYLKGIDFHSRLDSCLNVPSVDIGKNDVSGWRTASPTKMVRALMIRTFLKKQKKVKAIDRDLLTYLIHVPLQHGVRSLQRIILASELDRTPVFERYHLPPIDVLQLHVKGLDIDTVDPVSEFVDKLEGYDVSAEPEPIELKWKNKNWG